MFIVNSLLPVIIVVLTGLLWQKFNPKSNLGKIADIIVFISSPALAFAVIINAQFAWKDFLLVFLAAFFVMLIAWLGIRFIFYGLFQSNFSQAALPVIFINSGNIGLSLALFTYGLPGLSLAIIYHTAVLMAVYSWGIALVKPNSSLWPVFKLPHLYVCTIALVMNYYNLKAPLAISRGIELLGQLTIPLMLFILGSQLAKVKIGAMWRLALTASFLRIGLGLLGAVLFVLLFQIKGMTAEIIILLSIMPGAIVTQTICYKYYGRAELTSAIVALSTFMAVFYLPLALLLLQYLN